MQLSFPSLTVGVNFREAMVTICRRINELAVSFTNVRLVSEDSELFTNILPQEFNIRSLSMPYVLTNFVDWRSICLEKYGCSGKSLVETAK